MLWAMDWLDWHAAYNDPSSSLSARLRQAQKHLSEAIGQAPAGSVRGRAGDVPARRDRDLDQAPTAARHDTADTGLVRCQRLR
jgi:hypothetical protein